MILSSGASDGNRLIDSCEQLGHRFGCTAPFVVATGARQGVVPGPLLSNFSIEDIMLGTVDQRPADIVIAPSGPLTDLGFADDVVFFAESITKVQHGLRLRPDKCKQMWISLGPRTGAVDG
ncbi:hypothetical protein RB195_007687 [Necator americanus]|uniref:Reverse transcriptase domain-containing protein n=1 Tax=Necator americanus TaxID=51031 RepID=A0ABR1C128_NECAM